MQRDLKRWSYVVLFIKLSIWNLVALDCVCVCVCACVCLEDSKQPQSGPVLGYLYPELPCVCSGDFLRAVTTFHGFRSAALWRGRQWKLQNDKPGKQFKERSDWEGGQEEGMSEKLKPSDF